MKLGDTQRKFARMIGHLLMWAYENGYEITFGDVWAKTGHRPGSLHGVRLAADLNLFIDGVYQRETSAHKPLGEYWESIGGTWGGRFSKPDGNHYSLAWNGRK